MDDRPKTMLPATLAGPRALLISECDPAAAGAGDHRGKPVPRTGTGLATTHIRFGVQPEMGRDSRLQLG